MRRRLLTATLAVLFAAGAWYFSEIRSKQQGQAALAATGLEFLTFDQALARARSEGRPVLADFSAIWCPSCRALHQTVFTNPAVQTAIRSRYELALIDYDSAEAPAFMQRYGVTGFPSLLLIDADGRELRRLPVALDPQAFVAALSD